MNMVYQNISRGAWLLTLLVVCSTFLPCYPTPNSSASGRFPTTGQLGFQGQIQFGEEPSLIYSLTQPGVQDQFPILEPKLDGTERGFNVARHWGNLSPMFSLPRDAFGVQSGPEIPPGCSINQLHLLHRHGARFPSLSPSLSQFTKLIHSAQTNGTFEAKGALAFLKTWKNRLGTAALTPFGRAQMFQLGVSYRQKYGFLFDSDSDGGGQKTQKALPVFRTTSQHRMYHSALNFGAGFFGVPNENQYNQLIVIDQKGFNNTLAPHHSCPRTGGRAAYGLDIIQSFKETSLKNPQKRLNRLVSGIRFSISDIDMMQSLCAHESVALGTSAFCSLFTPEEWLDFAYACDLKFWYSASFGNDMSAALGAGWTEELLARLTKTQPSQAKTSINITLDSDPVTFPLNQTIFVDATHDIMLASVIVALNFTTLAHSGPLPLNKRLERRAFRTAHIVPFGAQLAAQVLTCPCSTGANSSRQSIRFVLNDAVVPLDGMHGCGADRATGLCDLDRFIAGLRARLSEIDFQKTCFGP